MVLHIDYCDYGCNRCDQVCPTEAVQPLDLAAKNQIRIGLAQFDPGRCLPYAFDHDCIVYEEHCPVPKKPIYFAEAEVVGRDGSRRLRKVPKVDPDL